MCFKHHFWKSLSIASTLIFCYGCLQQMQKNIFLEGATFMRIPSGPPKYHRVDQATSSTSTSTSSTTATSTSSTSTVTSTTSTSTSSITSTSTTATSSSSTVAWPWGSTNVKSGHLKASSLPYGHRFLTLPLMYHSKSSGLGPNLKEKQPFFVCVFERAKF